jgi:hypothetical protein
MTYSQPAPSRSPMQVRGILGSIKRASRNLPIYCGYVIQAFRTRRLIRKGGSDVERWSDLRNFEQYWEGRNRIIAGMIRPGSRILEFGAGRQFLREILPPGCAYTPSDLCDRGRGTIVCNLNDPVLPEFPISDIIVLSGVLEYLYEVPRVLSSLKPYCSEIILSYALAGPETNLLQRRGCGFVNDYSEEEILSIITGAGLAITERKTWDSQLILGCKVGSTEAAQAHSPAMAS